jgi:hypothetical protein
VKLPARIGKSCLVKVAGTLNPMIEALDIKREVESLSDRLGKTQDYL